MGLQDLQREEREPALESAGVLLLLIACGTMANGVIDKETKVV